MAARRSGSGLVAERLWQQVRTGWPFVTLTCAVLPLLWLAIALSVRSGLFALSGPPNRSQLGAFLTFIGACLGTAATAFAALLTRAHNSRERQRLRLETVIKSLESLPPDAVRPRLAGVLSTMVLLGQERVAIRVLQPAWDKSDVDGGTATWLIGQVLTGNQSTGVADGDRVDDAALIEASVLLINRADQLADQETGRYYFPGHFLRHWGTRSELPVEVRRNLLLAMGQMLAGRDKSWWSPAGDLPKWPTIVLLECVRQEPSQTIRMSAAVLLAALSECFPGQFRNRVPADDVSTILELAAIARSRSSVPAEYFTMADRIRSDWRQPKGGQGVPGEVEVRGVAMGS